MGASDFDSSMEAMRMAQKRMKKRQAQSGLYFDFEGRKGEDPALMGVLFETVELTHRTDFYEFNYEGWESELFTDSQIGFYIKTYADFLRRNP